MIITRPKSIEEILNMLALFPNSNICVIGCGICARKIKTGGEPEVKEMVARLQEKGIDVLGGVMVKHACSAKSWQDLVEDFPILSDANLLLVMSCGTGVSLLGYLSEKISLPALDTTSMGAAIDNDIFENMCRMCGQCNVGQYIGLCPKSGCPKSQVNGPCGGSSDGNCEISDRECIWVKIYEAAKTRGMLSSLNEIMPPIQHDLRF